MSGDLTMRVETRDAVGGGASRALRRTGMIPAVIYGEKGDNVHFAVDPRDIETGLRQASFFTTLFDLKIGPQKETVLVKDIQFHPVKDTPLHVDFLRVTPKSEVKVRVPLVFTNEARCPGLKQGGTLTVALRDVALRCKADTIPSRLEINLEGRDLNARMTIADLTLSEGIQLADPRQAGATIANIVPPKVKQSAATEEAAAPEAAEPAS